MHRILRLLTACALAIVIGCATAAQSGNRTTCALTPLDSMHLASGPLYRECAVDRPARLLTRDVRLDFDPAPATGTPACYRAEIEVIVDTAGVPEAETARLLQATDVDFGEAVLRTVPALRYRPARKDGAAVRQVVQQARALAVVPFSTTVIGARPVPPPPSTPPTNPCR
jgi:hypothetical protein